MGSQRRRAVLGVILALVLWSSVQAQASLSARWTAPHTAQIEWSGGSLWRIADGRETWIAGPSPQILSAGGDQNYAPRPGDRYEVRSTQTSAVVAVAFLGEEPKWHRVTLVLVVRQP